MSLIAHLVDEAHGGRTQQMLALAGESLAEGIKLLKGHALEEMGKHLLLGFIVGIETGLHQHEQRRIEQEAEQHALAPTGKAYKLEQRVGVGERAVKIEHKKFLHF